MMMMMMASNMEMKPTTRTRQPLGSGVIVLLLFVTFTTFVSVSGSYVVLAPQVVHPGWPLNIAVSIHKTTLRGMPVSVTASLTDKNKDELVNGDIKVNAGQSKILSLQVPPMTGEKNYEYTLKIEGAGGLEFSNVNQLTLNTNMTLTFVQTDKNIYKPGQLVRFRIVQVNKDLVPVQKPLVAYVLNTKGNKLERYDQVTSETGVVSRKFQLSKFASLGTWIVQLQNEQEDVVYQHRFQVDEYVLPKFSVEVIPDPDFLVWGVYDQPPGIIVKSLYTFGKAVQGECILTLGQMGSPNQQKLSQKIPSSGIVEFTDINWSSLIGAKPNTKKMLLALVEVKDIMGRTERGEATMDVFRQDYKVEILPRSPEIIHSGLETEFYIKISDHYNNPATGQMAEVTLDMPDMSKIKVRVIMDEGKSYATLKIKPVWDRMKMEIGDSQNFGLDLEGKLTASLVDDSTVTAVKDVSWYHSITLQSIKIQVPEVVDMPMGKPFTFDLTKTQTSSAPTTMYTVVSQGIILETGIVSGSTLTVTPTFDMCPKARVVIYQFVTATGSPPKSGDEDLMELIADAFEFSPSMCMDKQVNVNFDAMEQRTGTDANLQINVQMKDKSQLPRQVHDIFYLAVDKSVVLLQGDTTMTEDKIMNVLDKTNSWTTERVQTTADSIFLNFNLRIATSAQKAVVNPTPVYYYDDMEDAVMDADTGAEVPEQNANNNKFSEVAVETPKETAQPNGGAKKIRKDFPDTWLWNHGKTTESGQYRTQVRLPDTITSWYVSAFGINDNGIVGSGTPFDLTAFNPFFVSMNLPYSIKRGEVFSLRVTVFNYRPQEITSIVSLEMSDDFIITGGQPKNNYMEQVVTMLPNLASELTYEINASTIGKIKFHIVAQDAQDAGQRDEIIRELRVKPPGEERNQVITDVLLLVDDSSLTRRFEIDWPYDEIIEGSQRLQVKVTATVLGQSLSNLETLVRQPTGCGEQNMIGLVPNVYGATYIESTKQPDTDGLVKDMIKNMNIGYQRQVDLYKRTDGAYSAWASDETGSTWLTAFVLKSFAAAKEFIQVDEDVLGEAISFMATKQKSSGYFKEDGRILHTGLQTGTASDLPLTVYCLLSILETAEHMSSLDLDSLLSKTVPLIKRSTSKIISEGGSNTMLPAMTAYTLALVGKHDPSQKDAMAEMIEGLLNSIKDSSPWISPPVADDVSASTPLHSSAPPRPTVVMTAAYTLLTYVKLGDTSKAFGVMKWLQARQNNNGGFGSTQDTVLVLQSLAEFGTIYSDIQPTGQVEVTVPGTDFKDTLDISGSRAILLQQLDLPVDSDKVEVTLTGETNTVAFVKVVSYYNTPVTIQVQPPGIASKTSGVDIKTTTRFMSEVYHEVEACVTSTLKQGVGMYVTTLNLASGEVPSDSVEVMKTNNPQVSQVEVEEGVIHFYMNDIPRRGSCVKAQVERQQDFAVQQPGSAKVYSYYEPDEHYKESELALVDPNSKCQGGPCGGAPALPLASLVLTILICFMTSLLACL